MSQCFLVVIGFLLYSLFIGFKFMFHSSYLVFTYYWLHLNLKFFVLNIKFNLFMKYYYQSINSLISLDVLFIFFGNLFNLFVNFSFIVYHFKFIRKFVYLCLGLILVKLITRVILVETGSFFFIYDRLKIFINI